MKQFVAGFVTAAVLVGGAGLWAVKRADEAPPRWPPPTFYDDGDARPDSGYINAQGSLVGEDMNGSTFLESTCTVRDRTCKITSLQSLGSHRLVTIWHDAYLVTSWKADQVVAESTPPETACNRVRLVIDRVAKVVHYYRIPQPNADKAKCSLMYTNNKVFDWTLGEQPI